MPAAWSPKDERQYKHILKSCRSSRRGGSTCKRIAAATVNKRRSREGRTLGEEITCNPRWYNPGAAVALALGSYMIGRAIAKNEDAKLFAAIAKSLPQPAQLQQPAPQPGA